MAIDPERLEAQRAGLHLVPKSETRCARCGCRTRDAAGVCRDCKRELPDLSRLSVERLTGLIEAAKAELKRRRDEIDAAMGGA